MAMDGGHPPDLVTPWPEFPVPRWADPAVLGPLVHGWRNRLVWGEGTPGAPLCIILDNPGRRERPEGQPWVCPARQVARRSRPRPNLYPTLVDDLSAAAKRLGATQ